jgi:hypothetical protein
VKNARFDAARQIARKEGPFYEKWKAGILRHARLLEASA